MFGDESSGWAYYKVCTCPAITCMLHGEHAHAVVAWEAGNVYVLMMLTITMMRVAAMLVAMMMLDIVTITSLLKETCL